MKIKYTVENLKHIYIIFRDKGSCRNISVFCSECLLFGNDSCPPSLAFKESKSIYDKLSEEDKLELLIGNLE